MDALNRLGGLACVLIALLPVLDLGGARGNLLLGCIANGNLARIRERLERDEGRRQKALARVDRNELGPSVIPGGLVV